MCVNICLFVVNVVAIIWLFCIRSWVCVCGEVALMWEVVWGFVNNLVSFVKY